MLHLIGYKKEQREMWSDNRSRKGEYGAYSLFATQAGACVCVRVCVQDCTQGCVEEPINAIKKNVRFSCRITGNSLPVEQ